MLADSDARAVPVVLRRVAARSAQGKRSNQQAYPAKSSKVVLPGAPISIEVQPDPLPSCPAANSVAAPKRRSLPGSGHVQRHLCSDPRPGHRNRAAVVALDQTRVDEHRHVSVNAAIVSAESLREGADR